jgi:hypothetical protein
VGTGRFADLAPSISIRQVTAGGWNSPGTRFSVFLPIFATGNVYLRLAQMFDQQTEGIGFADCLHLTYPCELGSETVRLQSTPCNYGGSRLWFLCPVAECERRCAILYYYGTGLRCRKCCDLIYQCQNEDACSRAFRRAKKQRARVSHSIWWRLRNPTVTVFPERPKGMHLKTYERAHNEWEASLATGFANLNTRVARIKHRINSRYGDVERNRNT